MTPAPCKDCKERTQGCHSRCERYKEYDSANKERRTKIHKAKFRNNMLRSMKRDGCEKQRRRHQ